MPSPENASKMGAQTVLEHLIQNDVISETDIYDGLTEEVADIIFSVITLALRNTEGDSNEHFPKCN